MSDTETLVNLDSQGLAVLRAALLHVSTNSVATLKVLTVVAKAWCSFEVVSYVFAFFGDLCSKKFLHLPFSKEVSHETGSWRPLFRRSRLSSVPCSFFDLSAFFVAGVVGALWSPKHRFTWQVQDIRHFFIRVAGAALAAHCLAGVGQNKRWFWRSFSVAGAILCRPLSKSARSSGKTFFFTFLMFILHGARNVLRTSNMCSRNLLVTLSLSDRSRCGTVRFFVTSLSLWRSVSFEFARATLSVLWACPITRCGAVFIFITKEILCRDLDTEVFYGQLAQRPWHGDLFYKFYQ